MVVGQLGGVEGEDAWMGMYCMRKEEEKRKSATERFRVEYKFSA